MSVLHWLLDAFAEAVDEAGECVRGLSGTELNAPIFSFVFLILFTAKIFGVLTWPWWAVFVPLIAAPLALPVWWVAILPALFIVHVLWLPLSRLMDWSSEWRGMRRRGER